MPAKKTPAKKSAAKKPTSARTTTGKTSGGLTKEERAAMKERLRELKAEASESDLLAKIDEMPAADRAIGKKLHALMKECAPDLAPKTWYGMPAWAKDGKILCFFQSAAKFGARYATFGFSDVANLDEGAMWPTSFALTKLTGTEEAKIKRLVKKAVG